MPRILVESNEREVLMKRMAELVDDFQDQWEKKKVVLILDRACDNGRAGRAVERMWARRFCNPQILVIPVTLSS